MLKLNVSSPCPALNSELAISRAMRSVVGQRPMQPRTLWHKALITSGRPSLNGRSDCYRRNWIRNQVSLWLSSVEKNCHYSICVARVSLQYLQIDHPRRGSFACSGANMISQEIHIRYTPV